LQAAWYAEKLSRVHLRSNRQLKLAGAFVLAARRYWLGVFPIVRSEIRGLQLRARHIPEPELRLLAIYNLRAESGDLEGAAAFATFLPRTHRNSVVRAQIAFQAAYDYVDSLAEQPHASPVNARRLHYALIVALSPETPHLDYYAHHVCRDDDGYLAALVDTCRHAIGRLPAYPLVAEAIHRNVRRIVAYQTRTNLTSAHGHRAMARWAGRETPPETGLWWWETGAACGSSMAVLALLAAAADPRLTRSSARAVEAVYWPWAGALHSLLDSLVDRTEDAAKGQHSLVAHYSSPQEMAARLEAIATEAARRAAAAGVEHSLILTGMASLYLSDPQAWLPQARPTTEGVLDALGDLAKPTMLVLRARRHAHRNSRS
jgi:tetraprenyl-beta-curcumene synthase